MATVTVYTSEKTQEIETAVNDHISDAVDSHNASAISFDPSGLVILSGITDIQAALAQIDAAAQPRSGTIASRPAVGTVPEGARYLATDIDGGAEYQKLSGVWAQTGAAVDAGSGQQLSRVTFAQQDFVVGTTDVTGGTFAANIPQVSYPVDIWLHLDGSPLTVGTGSLLTVGGNICDPADVILMGRLGYASTWRPAGAAAADVHTVIVAAHQVPYVPDVFYRRDADVVAANYKARITVAGAGYVWRMLASSWMMAIGR